MGTDIHMFVEVRRDGKWHNATRLISGKPDWEGRNYDLFAILGNVRNGSGFAGVKTGDGFVPLTDHRGVPDDASDEVRKLADDGCDHSHSHCTVAELIAYDWTRVTQKCGVVDTSEMARWLDDGRPQSWSGSIFGRDVVVIDADEKVRTFLSSLCDENRRGWWELVRGERTPHTLYLGQRMASVYGSSHPHFFVKWEIHYYDAAAQFLWGTMPRLWRLGNPEDVRLVFWFDS